MRIAFLFNYPLVDNRPWKQTLIRELAGDHELMVLFGKSRLRDYLAAYMRRRAEIDVGERLRNTGPAPAQRTVRLLRELDVPCRKFASVNAEPCQRALRAFAPDYVVTALDHRLDKATLDCAPLFLNAHYGTLPRVRGWNATEWSLLLERQLTVSLHRVAPGLDTGEIYLTRPVPVARDYSLEDVRARCQERALEMYRDFFANPEGVLARAQPNEGGDTYYAMSREMKDLVRSLVRSGAVA